MTRYLLTVYHRRVALLPDHLQDTYDQIKENLDFNSFAITGGPCPRGTGSLCIYQYVFRSGISYTLSFISSVMTGHTIRGAQTFEDFCGPLFHVLKDKYCEWLNLSFSEYSPTLCT